MYRGILKHPSIAFFLLLLVVCMVTVSCGSRVKNSLNNFSAYYNTFYNAKQSFETGLKKQKLQQQSYNPERPIRIHPVPVNAGGEDFQVAIEKSADVIRKFEDSKWVDDAVELIGKSYYYRKEFFSADQKFQELYQAVDDPQIKQRAVLWRGRTYLEMKLHEQAIDFLTDQLSLFDGSWDRKLRAETNAILAQHYVAVENWERAEELLRNSIDDLPSGELKAKGYFLFGQILQKNGKPEEAEQAFSRVEDHFKNYDLLYYANLKKVQVSRSLGNTNEAYQMLSSMIRDDKNVDQIISLQYELGRTEQERGNIEEAQNLYMSILRNNRNRPDAITLAKTYYGLGEINQKYYNDFAMAAAYYDSAASQRITSEQLSDEFNASELAQSYGEYSRLKTEIARKDSLLWLASLSDTELDSVILEIKKKRKAELEKEMQEAESRRNTLVTVNTQGQQQGQAVNSQNGFLNYKNPVMLADARAQFKAIWGDRPLADNWRRISDIQSSLTSENGLQAGNRGGVLVRNKNIRLSDIQVDLSEVPFTEKAKDSVKTSLGELNFQLGNLFFLSLEMPDSAEYYYNEVLNDYPGSDAVPVALYSLSELKSATGNNIAAHNFANRLIESYPNSIYAERLAKDFDLKLEQKRTVFDAADSLRMVLTETLTNRTMSDTLKAEKLKVMAYKYPKTQTAPEALFQSAMLYASLAKDSIYYLRFVAWDSLKTAYRYKQQGLKALKDSASAALKDSALSESKRTYWSAVIDSSLQEPAYHQYFPYKGAYWDSTRTLLSELISGYPTHVRSKEARRLSEELSVPSGVEIVSGKTEEKVDTTSVNQPAGNTTDSYISCLELNKAPTIKGGKKQFSEQIKLPENALSSPMPEEARYLFYINRQGGIDSYQLLSRSLETGLKRTIEKAIDDFLIFEPVFMEGEAVPVKCEVTFPLAVKPEN